MPVAQERHSCENVSLERRAFCMSTFLCVSGEWRRIEDPFIRTSLRVRVPDAKNFDGALDAFMRTSLPTFVKGPLSISLVARVAHMKCSNARDTW